MKNAEVKDEFNAKGIKQAKKELSVLKLSDKERKEYERYIEQVRYEESMITSNYMVGREEGIIEGIEKGREEERRIQEAKRKQELADIEAKRKQELADIEAKRKKELEDIEEKRKQEQIESAKKMKEKGFSFADISDITGITTDEIEKL
jgi:hypothetical protein